MRNRSELHLLSQLIDGIRNQVKSAPEGEFTVDEDGPDDVDSEDLYSFVILSSRNHGDDTFNCALYGDTCDRIEIYKATLAMLISMSRDPLFHVVRETFDYSGGGKRPSFWERLTAVSYYVMTGKPRRH